MTPVRSVAASVVALGFASALTAPLPALANPAPCRLADHYAAQAGAQVLRINRLDLGPVAIPGNRRGAPDGPAQNDRRGVPDGHGESDPPKGGAAGRGAAGDDATGSEKPGARSGAGSKTDVNDEQQIDGTGGSGGAGRGASGGSGSGSGDGASSRGGSGDGASSRGGSGGGAKVSGENAADERAGTGGSGAGIFGPTAPQSISGVGLGDARTVVIADNPVRSAAAARLLDGRVAGSPATDGLVVQQAPPDNPRPASRQTAEKRFGPLRAGTAELTAQARWNSAVECATADASASSAEIRRITLTGAGNESLLRVPEKISGRSSTALRNHDGRLESVASATLTAGRISLADNEVRIRVLRAPTLQVSMPVSGEPRVDYRPALVEVSGKNIPTKRLETVRDHIDITLREEARTLESLPALIKPISPLPLPPITGLPTPGEPETAPATPRTGDTRLRISLGDVRHASKDKAVAARADAIKISLIRDGKQAQDHRVKPGYGPSSLVADLAIGLLEGAAVAPQPGSGVSSGQSAAGSGGGAAADGLPITGPRAASLALSGVALLIGGVAAVLFASRRRRSHS